MPRSEYMLSISSVGILNMLSMNIEYRLKIESQSNAANLKICQSKQTIWHWQYYTINYVWIIDACFSVSEF